MMDRKIISYKGKLTILAMALAGVLTLGIQGCETNKSGEVSEVVSQGQPGVGKIDLAGLEALGCHNGVKDGQETDVDCGGGECPQCIPFKSCAQDSDCLSTYSASPGSPPFTGITCTDSVQVNNQTVTWNGTVCMSGELYGAVQTLADAWAQQSGQPGGGSGTCANGVKDPDESDVDCGGPCPACGPFKACQSDQDCQTTADIGGKQYTAIRCDNQVASFTPNQPVDLGSYQCINEGLYWDAIAAALAQASASGSTGGGATSGTGTGGAATSGTGTGGTGTGGTATSGTGTGGTGTGGAATSGTGTGGTGTGGAATSGTGTGGTGTGGTGTGGAATSGTGTGGTGTGGTGTGGAATSGTGTSGTSGTDNTAELADCSDGQLNNNETDVDCGGGVCPACPPFKKCTEDSDCQANATLNNKNYTGITCEKVPNSTDWICVNQELWQDLQAAIADFFASLPIRNTPQGCQDFQYTFVSDKDGADNVYGVPCDDNGFNVAAVKLTDNTDPNLRYDSIAIRPDAHAVLYGTTRDGDAHHLRFDPDPIIGVPDYELEMVQGFMEIDPTWEPGNEYFGFVRYNPSLEYVIATTTLDKLDNPGRMEGGSKAEIRGFDFSPSYRDSSSPGYGKTVYSQKGSDGKFYLIVRKQGDPFRYVENSSGNEFKQWGPIEGQNPVLSPDGSTLAYVMGNKILFCAIDFNVAMGPFDNIGPGVGIYKCSSSGIETVGSDAMPASSPCWSANGKYIYFQTNYLSVDFIARYDVNTKETVILDEFRKSPAGKGERNPGCYPVMH